MLRRSAHNQFRQSAVERRLFGRRGDDAIRVDDDHPVLFIEPKGHGIEAFHGGTNWPMLKASSSIGIRVRQRDRTVPALPVPVRAPGATLFRSPRPCGPLRGTETVICTPECLTTERGRCRYAQMGTSCASTRRQLVRSVQRSAGQLVAATWHGRRGGWYDAGRAGGRRPTAGRMVPDTGRNDQASFRSGRRPFRRRTCIILCSGSREPRPGERMALCWRRLLA